MAETDNLFQTTQNLLDPASIQHMSATLGEPSEDIQMGLRSVIPTCMSGLITKGSTPEGAEEIVHLAQEQGGNPAELMQELFGDQYHEAAKSLSPESGVSSQLMEKLMSLVAPSILRSLLKTIRDEKMTPEALANFLQRQRRVLKGYIPRDFRAQSRMNASIQKVLRDDEMTPPRFGKKKFPLVLIFFLILAFGVFAWLFSREKQTVRTITRNLSDVHTSSTTRESLTTGTEELSDFLKSRDAIGVPKRFTFKEVAFVIGSTDFSHDGTAELDMVAAALKRYPGSVVRVEAYIENTGDPEENLLLSENRAMLIREELLGRGVEPSRVRAEGLGATIGRGQVELVVRQLK